MINRLFIVFFIFSTSHTAFANLLETKNGSKQIAEVTLAESAVWTLAGKNQNLKMVSAGLRTKKVVFVNVSVYVAEWFVSSTAPWAQSIENLKNLAPVVMRMTFLRDIEAPKIESAFRESLVANKIDLTEPPFKAFLKAFLENGDIKKKSSMTLAGHFEPDGSEVLSFESTSNKVTEIKGPSGFLQKIYSIWFGESADSGLADLKKALLEPAK
ncbi:MAG: chalcone isomerase family protein [Bdellovibrionales bacterium]|nr:chalcone isomerase family protein [Bdellovibrionales bacterium]